MMKLAAYRMSLVVFLFTIFLGSQAFMPRIASFAYLLSPPAAFAAEDPLARPNNFAGIHILFTHELDQAHDLVNSSGGDWGYVTIPIQAGDRDLEKWQDFMDQAKEKHIIPIIRLATEPFFKNTATWRKPDNYDLLDFANFLDSLEWPTKNRYVILFNEVNRFDEWGGEPPSPSEYAEIVAYANEVFKSRNESFYLILSGMDAAAPDDFIKYINGFTYLKDLMSDPRITDSIDGFSSHSYPNPDFGAPPMENKKVGIATYRYEYDLINSYSDKKIPVFITETGWGNEKLPDSVVSKYLTMSVKDIWSKDADKIVAVTPFLLNSVGGPFDKFSFIKNGNKRDFYKTFAAVSKVKGSPDENKNVKIEPAKILAKAESFNSNENNEEIHPFVKFYMKTLLGLD